MWTVLLSGIIFGMGLMHVLRTLFRYEMKFDMPVLNLFTHFPPNEIVIGGSYALRLYEHDVEHKYVGDWNPKDVDVYIHVENSENRDVAWENFKRWTFDYTLSTRSSIDRMPRTTKTAKKMYPDEQNNTGMFHQQIIGTYKVRHPNSSRVIQFIAWVDDLGRSGDKTWVSELVNNMDAPACMVGKWDISTGWLWTVGKKYEMSKREGIRNYTCPSRWKKYHERGYK